MAMIVRHIQTRVAMQDRIVALWNRVVEAREIFGKEPVDSPKREIKRADCDSAYKRFREEVPVLATALRALGPIEPERSEKK